MLCFSFTNWKQVNVLGDQNTEWIRGTTSLDWKLAHEGSTLGIKLRLSFCGRPGHPLWSGSPDQLENDLLGLPPLCVNCCVDLEGMKKFQRPSKWAKEFALILSSFHWNEFKFHGCSSYYHDGSSFGRVQVNCFMRTLRYSVIFCSDFDLNIQRNYSLHTWWTLDFWRSSWKTLYSQILS